MTSRTVPVTNPATTATSAATAASEGALREHGARVLVVDDEAAIRTTLRVCLEGAGYRVQSASTYEQALAAARKHPPDAALVDVRLGPGGDGIALTRAIALEAPSCATVVMTAYATLDNAVDAMRAGAADYLPKPFTPAQVLVVLGRALRERRAGIELSELRRASSRAAAPMLASQSPAFQRAVAVVARAAASDATVLLRGPTGSGKGVLARHLHALSPRRARPFVTVNFATVAPSLVENELFGHARGAFTGADGPRAGHVEAAGSGTLFLDEVADLPREAQGKLLRLLEEREYVRVGDTEPRTTDARFIAATHRDLARMVREGLFREDLYYRLDVLSVRVPPLCERGEDLPALVRELLAAHAARIGRELVPTPEALAALCAYPWPGNVRELSNVLERATILAEGGALTLDLLPDDVRDALRSDSAADAHAPDDASDERLETAERRHIAQVIARHSTLDAAAKALGVDPSTLYRKRERYGLR